MTPAAILEALDEPDLGLPRGALLEAMDHPEEVIPGLLELVQAAVKDPAAYQEAHPDSWGPLYAFYLLAQFREPRALPVLLDLVRMDEEGRDEILDFLEADCLPSLLASFCAGTPTVLENLVLDEGLDRRVRKTALDALLVLAFQGRITQAHLERVLAGFLTAFEGRGDEVPSELWADLAYAIALAGCKTLAPRVLDAYDRDHVDEATFPMSAFEQSIARNPGHAQRRFVKAHHLVEDAILDLEDSPLMVEDGDPYDEDEDDDDWDEADDEPIIDPLPELPPASLRGVVASQGPHLPAATPGRNAPCPCGSGKKYKRCCGK